MSEHLTPDAADVERMLHDRAPRTPHPALRTRVLAAVGDALVNDRSAQPAEPDGTRELLPLAALMATALSLLIVAMLSWAAASRRDGSATDRPTLSFAQRAEAAGITLEIDTPSAGRMVSVQPHATDGPRHRDILRSIDARSILMGEL